MAKQKEIDMHSAGVMAQNMEEMLEWAMSTSCFPDEYQSRQRILLHALACAFIIIFKEDEKEKIKAKPVKKTKKKVK